VITLIAKMEQLRGEAVNAQIHASMETWLDSIKKVQARRHDEIINSTNRHHNIVAGIQTPRIQEDKGGCLLYVYPFLHVGHVDSHVCM
jgi:hypothetical protein